MPKLKCKKCGYLWQSNSETKVCPFCGTAYIENIEIKTKFFDIDEIMR
ncbi:MAG: hypothetical protein QW041_01450 [Candidatus Pacearchaeota archaeon]